MSQILVNFDNYLLHQPLWQVTNHPLNVLYASKKKIKLMNKTVKNGRQILEMSCSSCCPAD